MLEFSAGVMLNLGGPGVGIVVGDGAIYRGIVHRPSTTRAPLPGKGSGQSPLKPPPPRFPPLPERSLPLLHPADAA